MIAGLFYEPPASDFDKYFPTGWKHSDVSAAISRLYATQPSTQNPSKDGIYYEQSGYVKAKQWLVTNAGYTELNINANSRQKTKVFGHPAYDYSNGQRSGPVISYLQTALKRPNFHLQSGTWVQRVVRTGGVATGVTVVSGGVTSTIKLSATGRVILSGGALKSPELLMKSGIGDPAVLTTVSAALICSPEEDPRPSHKLLTFHPSIALPSQPTRRAPLFLLDQQHRHRRRPLR